jgi:hypothetical protein
MKRSILVQTAMAPRCIVVGGKLAKGPAQMCLVCSQNLIHALDRQGACRRKVVFGDCRLTWHACRVYAKVVAD